MTGLLGLVAELTSDDRRVAFPRSYVDWLEGDYVAAIVLNDCVWWSAQHEGTDRHGWFYRSSQDWERERWLSRKQVLRAIDTINDRAGVTVIERTLRQVDGAPTAHFRVNPLAFRGVLMDAILPKGKNATPFCPKGNILDFAQSAESTSKDKNRVKDIGDSPRIAGTDDSTPKRKSNGRAAWNESRHKSTVYADPEFIRFWNAYPRSDNKLSAAKAWYRRNPDPATIAAIHDALAWQVPHWRDTDQIMPHGATYLNHARWEDERPAAAVPAGANGFDPDALAHIGEGKPQLPVPTTTPEEWAASIRANRKARRNG